MATVLVSLLTDEPVRPLTAMTGEITLSGNVLPVGGIKEKFLAARRAGVQTIILPAENRQDVEEDLTPDLIGGVDIHYASRIEDVLAVALPLLKGRKIAASIEAESAPLPWPEEGCGRLSQGGPANLPALFLSLLVKEALGTGGPPSLRDSRAMARIHPQGSELPPAICSGTRTDRLPPAASNLQAVCFFQ